MLLSEPKFSFVFQDCLVSWNLSMRKKIECALGFTIAPVFQNCGSFLSLLFDKSLMGEKIETIIEELLKQDTLTLNILFSHSFLPKEIDLGLNKECCQRNWTCFFV